MRRRCVERLAEFFGKRGWQVRERLFGGVEWSFADKHNWARRGVLVAHAGFVIVAAGTTLYWARGFSGELAVLTGQTVQVPRTKAVVRLDNFSYSISPIMTKSGMVYQPIDYVSHVTVAGRDGTPKAMTLRVNHPIDVDGTLYYQASYGFGMKFLVTHDGRRDPNLSGRTLLGRRFVRGSRRAAQRHLRAFRPDGRQAERITRARSAGQRSRRRPRPSRKPATSWARRSFRSGAASISGGGWRVTPRKYVLYSGLQYRYDPGVALVGIGAFVLLAGLIISFYFLPARLYVRVDPAGAGRSRVGAAATTVKGYDVFANEFERLVVALGRTLDGDQTVAQT